METYAVIVPTQPNRHERRLYWVTAERGLTYDQACALAGRFAPVLGKRPFIEPSHRYRFSGFSFVNSQPQVRARQEERDSR